MKDEQLSVVEFLESVEVDKFAKDCIKHRYNSYGENITSESQKLDTIYGFKQGFQKAIELIKQQEREDILCNCSQDKGIDFDEMGVAYCISCEKAIN
jgi:hypothetical protein